MQAGVFVPPRRPDANTYIVSIPADRVGLVVGKVGWFSLVVRTLVKSCVSTGWFLCSPNSRKITRTCLCATRHSRESNMRPSGLWSPRLCAAVHLADPGTTAVLPFISPPIHLLATQQCVTPGLVQVIPPSAHGYQPRPHFIPPMQGEPITPITHDTAFVHSCILLCCSD